MDPPYELPDGTLSITITGGWANTPRDTTYGFLGYHWRLVQSVTGAKSSGIVLAIGKTSSDNIYETVQVQWGRTYTMYVSTMDRYGYTSAETASSPVTAFIDTTAPGAVTSLYAAGEALRVGLSWTQRPNSERVDYYGLMRTTDPYWGSAECVKCISHQRRLGSTTVGVHDHPPAAATMYYYCVVAVDRAGNESDASNVVQAQRGTAQLGIDVVESGTSKIFTSTHQAKLSGISEGADVTDYADSRIANNVSASYVDASHRPIVLDLAQIADGMLSKCATASVTSQSVPGEVGEYYAVVQTGHQTMKGGACLVVGTLRQKLTDSDTFQVGIKRNIQNGSSTYIYAGEDSTSVERIRTVTCIDTSPGTGQNDYVLWVKYNDTEGSCIFAEASISIINAGK